MKSRSKDSFMKPFTCLIVIVCNMVAFVLIYSFCANLIWSQINTIRTWNDHLFLFRSSSKVPKFLRKYPNVNEFISKKERNKKKETQISQCQ